MEMHGIVGAVSDGEIAERFPEEPALGARDVNKFIEAGCDRLAPEAAAGGVLNQASGGQCGGMGFVFDTGRRVTKQGFGVGNVPARWIKATERTNKEDSHNLGSPESSGCASHLDAYL